ncbi:hypothetical protein BGZ75_005160 [Mortierella antarctica]|nr:hypothetical protein BGZ75_005160 [Mortierella antarctica]
MPVPTAQNQRRPPTTTTAAPSSSSLSSSSPSSLSLPLSPLTLCQPSHTATSPHEEIAAFDSTAKSSSDRKDPATATAAIATAAAGVTPRSTVSNPTTTITTSTTGSTISSAGSTSTTMKADRKIDPLSPSVSIAATTAHQHLNSNNHSHTTTTKNITHNTNVSNRSAGGSSNSKKRKASVSERRLSSHANNNSSSNNLSDSTFNSVTEDLSHVLKPLSTNAKDKKTAASHEDPNSKKDEGQEFVVEMSGNLRKKRMVASRRAQGAGPSLEADGGQATHNSSNNDSNNDNNTGNPDSVVDSEPESNTRQRASMKQSDPKKRRKASVATAATADADAHSHRTKGTKATKASKDVKGAKDAKDASSSDTMAASKTQRRSHAAHASSATSAVDVASELSKGNKGTRSSTADEIPAAASPAASAEPSSQKRVLPSRGGMLRDKNAIPMEATLLEPAVPAGEYILYLGSEQSLQRATLDRKRVPPATYGGGEETDEDHSPSASTSGTAATAASAPSAEPLPPIPVSGSYSQPPPSAVTHIEVPLFKLCSIGQFLQEEKKRKMQLLSKALAKAEAEAAAEALANAKTNAVAAPQSSTSRSVSTRQKHKEIVQNQHVSVQTVVPSSSAASAHHHPNSKRATTTSTTLGKIEGIGSSAAQEEILSDEVYEKRHRKQEMAEKKVKNREKEKLRHAMYQQQLVVEKLRHMEINRLMPISAFRSLQKKEACTGTDDTASPPQHHQQQQQQQQQQSLISLAAARVMQDEYHRRLLREAEENLRRYEQLGLGESSQATVAPAYSPFSRTRNRLVHLGSLLSQPMEHAMANTSSVSTREKSAHQRSDSTGYARSRKKVKASMQSSDATATTTATATAVRPRAKTVSSTSSPFSPAPNSPSATATTTASPSQQKAKAKGTTALPQEPPRPPKPITTFIKPGSALASGARKSSRVALAFGEKVPMVNRIDFDLPLDTFVDLIQARFGDEEPVVKSYRKTKKEKQEKEEKEAKEMMERAEHDQQQQVHVSPTSGEMESNDDTSNGKSAQATTTPLLSGSASVSSASSTLSLSSVATTTSSASTTIL